MLKKTKKGYYEVKELKKFKGLIHGFSTRKFGDLRKNPAKFLTALGLKRKDLVLMEQVHGTRIKVVGEEDKGKIILGIDGMVTNKKGIVLGVKTADCLPILFYEPVEKIIGVVHAGWKGVLKKIGQKMVDLLIMKGSSPGNILVGIGPHIGSCCYKVENQRVKKFISEFGKLENMLRVDKKDTYLNLEIPIIRQLVTSGILKNNIFLSSICTSCQNQEFFSYRKDSKKSYGEMLGTLNI